MLARDFTNILIVRPKNNGRNLPVLRNTKPIILIVVSPEKALRVNSCHSSFRRITSPGVRLTIVSLVSRSESHRRTFPWTADTRTLSCRSNGRPEGLNLGRTEGRVRRVSGCRRYPPPPPLPAADASAPPRLRARCSAVFIRHKPNPKAPITLNHR